MCVLPTCMHVLASPQSYSQSPQDGSGSLRNGVGWLWASIWVLGTDPRSESSERASPLHYWATSPSHILCLILQNLIVIFISLKNISDNALVIYLHNFHSSSPLSNHFCVPYSCSTLLILLKWLFFLFFHKYASYHVHLVLFVCTYVSAGHLGLDYLLDCPY